MIPTPLAKATPRRPSPGPHRQQTEKIRIAQKNGDSGFHRDDFLRRQKMIFASAQIDAGRARGGVSGGGNVAPEARI